jgi:GNAT superfamily N-acetyltransferase
MGDWYKKLTEYFPANEMKSREHMEALFSDKTGMYVKEEGPHHVLVYLETEDFIFIDYILITNKSRGKGVGSKLLESLKAKDKPIILEVDPVDSSNPDTAKRVRFYERNGFTQAKDIEYKRIHAITSELNVMNIFYWSSAPRSERWVFTKMQGAYEQVHAYKARQFYGKEPQRTEEVLSFPQKSFSRAN